MIGDVYEDGMIGSKDLNMIRDYITGSETLTDVQKLTADLNQDGDIDDVFS